MHTYAPFLVERAFEQVKLDLGHQGGRAVLVSIGASYDAARAGRTHQAPEDVALVDAVPGFAVQVPGHPDEVPGLLRGAVGVLDSRSTYLRLSSESNRSALPVWPGLQVVRSGREAVVVAVGPMLSPVLDAVGDLDVTVAYATTVRPFDGEGLRALARRLRGRTGFGDGDGGAGRAVPGRDVGALRCRRRWPGGRSGCSAWGSGGRSCGGTGRLPITPRGTGWMRRGSGAR